MKQLLGKHDPLIGGQVFLRPLEQHHNGHIKVGGEWFSNFSYNSLKRYKKRLRSELECSKCTRHLLVIAGYLKWHTALYPATKHICTAIMKEFLTLEGQELYEGYPEIRSHIYDFKLMKKCFLQSGKITHCGYMKISPLIGTELKC